MYVVKRNGTKEKVQFDKITARLARLCTDLNEQYVDPIIVAQKVCNGIYNGVTTFELDELAAETAAHLMTVHPDFGQLAARIAVSNLHKTTSAQFSNVIDDLFRYTDPVTGEKAQIIASDVHAFVMANREKLDQLIDYSRDFTYDYFGFKTLCHGYLLKMKGKIVERPQQMLLRVACGIHTGNLDRVVQTYELMSLKYFTHATPTLFNAGTVSPQMSSCFLLRVFEDSIDGIYETLKACALISKQAGGIGLAISNIRASGSYIRGTNGTSNGLIPMIRVFNATARYVDQCFATGTIVYTLSGPKKIEDVTIFDHVLSVRGYNQVNQILQYEVSGTMIEITTDLASVLVTEKHQVLTVQIGEEYSDLTATDILNRLWVGFFAVRMIDADQITPADYVILPKKCQIYLNLAMTAANFIEYNDYILVPVHSVTKKEYSGSVYDFEVDNDHCYTTALALAHNGGGKRKGAFALYLEPWHADIFDFLNLKKNHGDEEERARDLFYGLWIPDLFMERVKADGPWSLFCPKEAPGLDTTYGEAFQTLYEKYEGIGLARRTVKARDLFLQICQAQIETGTPYILYKDACNRKSNQKNLGTISCSNLCTEIIQYTSFDEVAVCNLASLSLPKFIKDNTFDFEALAEVTRVVTYNLNRVIDRNSYPVPEARRSNLRHRPIGIGVQGLADVFAQLRYPFDSPAAKQLNRQIFETIYFAALTESSDLAGKEGPYSTYQGSPASRGLFQFDLWGKDPGVDTTGKPGDSPTYQQWMALKDQVRRTGLRNSLLIAPMPTASTSQILGNNECFEPFTTNIYARRTLAGEFVCLNRYLLTDLLRRGLYTETLKNKIIAYNGSVQQIEEIPDDLKALYKTVWEISQKTIIDMAADRGPFIDQSQSLNIHMADVTFQKLSSMHFYTYEKGLKTGMYYLRTKAAVDPIKVTLNPMLVEDLKKQPGKISKESDQAKKDQLDLQKTLIQTDLDNQMACSRGGGSCSG